MNDHFMKVTATEILDEIGDAENKRVELKINYDLIGAIQGNEVLLKDGPELYVGGKRFSDFETIKTGGSPIY